MDLFKSKIRRRRKRDRADQITAGLAVVAIGTAGSVLVGEFVRLGHRRLQRRDSGREAHGAATPMELASNVTVDAITVAREGYSSAGKQETILFNLLTGFVASFGLARLSTAGIRAGWWPLGNVVVSGRHIHHFVPGVLCAFGAGAASLLTSSDRLEQVLAVPFGVGVGLTFDEAALLLDLRDVYWTREGLLSVHVSLAVSGLLGGTIIALRMLRRGEDRSVAIGAIPNSEGDWVGVAGSPSAAY